MLHHTYFQMYFIITITVLVNILKWYLYLLSNLRAYASSLNLIRRLRTMLSNFAFDSLICLLIQLKKQISEFVIFAVIDCVNSRKLDFLNFFNQILYPPWKLLMTLSYFTDGADPLIVKIYMVIRKLSYLGMKFPSPVGSMRSKTYNDM